MARVQGPNGKLGAGLISVWAQELPNIHYGAGISFSSRAPGRRGLTDIARLLQSVSSRHNYGELGFVEARRQALAIDRRYWGRKQQGFAPTTLRGWETDGRAGTDKRRKGSFDLRELPMQTASYALVPLLPTSCRVLLPASSTRPDTRGALQKRAPTSTFVPYTSWRWRELNPLVPVLRGAAQRVEIWRDVRKYTTVLTRL